ncbi:MAG: hypothetical protein FWH41_02445 [Treponema sp.]|nr:hypothetical protein [Treponema sp.]
MHTNPIDGIKTPPIDNVYAIKTVHTNPMYDIKTPTIDNVYAIKTVHTNPIDDIKTPTIGIKMTELSGILLGNS